MVKNMSCFRCPQEAIEICKNHPSIIFLCLKHSEEHIKEDNHSPNMRKKQLEIRNIRNLKSFIRQSIADIMNDTKVIILALKDACHQAINELKAANKNIKSITQFKPLSYQRERIDFLQREAKLIFKNLEMNMKEEKAKKESNQPKIVLNQGSDFLEFNNKSIEQKKVYIMNNWAFINENFRLGPSDKEFLLSGDGKYLFRCDF